MLTHDEENANYQLNPTHSDQAQKRKNSTLDFDHEKRLQIPIMIRRDAISLTLFSRLERPTAPRSRVQSRFKVYRAATRIRAICLNRLEQF